MYYGTVELNITAWVYNSGNFVADTQDMTHVLVINDFINLCLVLKPIKKIPKSVHYVAVAC